MLANPVVIPAEADPVMWMVAIVAMVAEIEIVVRVLRRGGLDTTRVTAWLWLIQLWSWFFFLMAIDRLGHVGNHDQQGWVIGVGEVLVFAVEAPLFWLAARAGRHRADPTRRGVTFGRAVLASALGNLTSLAVGLAVPAAILLLK